MSSSQLQIIQNLSHDSNVQLLSSDIGTFYLLNASLINGSCIASDDDINILSNNKIVTPKVLDAVLKSAGGGGLYPTNASFQSLVTSKLTITDDIIPVGNGGTGLSSYNDGDLLYGDTTSGLSKLSIGNNGQILQVLNGKVSWTDSLTNLAAFAEENDVFSGTTVDNKLMSPVITQTFMMSPPVIGYISSNDAKFKNITIDSLTSNTAYASSSEATDYSINDKIISPLGLSYSLSNPPKIGDVQANDGSFKSLNAEYLTVDNPPWPVISQYFADNTDVIARSSTDKSLNPSNIATMFSYPTTIGDGDPSSAIFTDLKANELKVTDLIVSNPPWPTLTNSFATNEEATQKTINNKSISPSNLSSIMANPGPIGNTVSYDAKFKSVTMENLSVTNPPWPTVNALYTSNSEALDSSIKSKGLAPSNVPTIMASPGPIGSTSPNTGKFSTLTTAKINITNDVLPVSVGGTGLNSYTKGDLLFATDTTTLSKLNTGQDGQFLQVSSVSPSGYIWTTLSGSVPEATTGSFGVTRYATPSEVVTYSGIGVLTTGQLPSLFSNPPSIGSTMPNSGTFSNLSVTGNLTLSNPITAKQGGTGLSTYKVGDLLYANTVSSLTTLSKGTDTQILQMVNGLPKWQPPLTVLSASINQEGIIQLANSIEAISFSEQTKAITPQTLSLALASPADIGSANPANATFNVLTVNSSLYFSNQFAIKPSNGGTGRTTYNLGDLLVGNNGSSLSVLSKGTVGQVLQVSPTGGLSWGNSGGVAYASTDSSGVVQFATDQQAIQQTIDDVVISPTNVTAILSNPSSIGNVTPNSGVFTDFKCTTFELTGDTVNPSEGGTGQSNYLKGDLLVATNTSTLTKVHLGNEGEFLQVDSSTASGVRWANVTLPTMYNNTDIPDYQSNTSYTISYSYSRAVNDNEDILINSLRTIDLTMIGLSSTNSGLAQSSMLTGTVTVNDTTVTHDSNLDFSQYFIPGDVISISGIGSRRIVSINESSLETDIPFASNNTNRTFYRGGRAPNTLYYLYALGHPTQPGYILSTRCSVNNQNFVDAPYGYDISSGWYRQLDYVFFTTETADFSMNTFTKAGYTSIHHYKINPSMLSTAFTTINLSRFVPQTAVLVDVNIRMKTTNILGGYVDIGMTNTTYNTVCEINEPDTIYHHLTVPIDIFQSFVVRLANVNCIAYITVQGYYCQ